MEPDSFYYFILLSVLILLSALFSASETAFFSLNRLRLERLVLEGNEVAKEVYERLQNPARLIATILIGNEAVNIAISSLLAALFIKEFGKEKSFYSIPVALFVLLIFGEITPKALAVRFSESYAFFIVRFLRFVEFVIYPLRVALVTVASFVTKPFGVELFNKPKVLSDEDFMVLVEEGAKEGFIGDEEKEIIFRTLDLSEVDVKEIMVPKDEIFALQEDVKVRDAIDLLKTKKFSRIPVYGKDLDDIRGILYAKKIIPLKLKEEDFEKPVKEFMDPPYFVTEFKRIDQLLEEMQKSKRHLAIVVDEYGNTVGIVTLDDILSFLVGEMPDEFGKYEKDFEPISENRFRISASMSIEEFKDHFDLEEKLEEEEEVDTVGGLIMKILGRIPKEGDFIIWRNFRFTVEKMEGNRVKKVLVEEIS